MVPPPRGQWRWHDGPHPRRVDRGRQRPRAVTVQEPLERARFHGIDVRQPPVAVGERDTGCLQAQVDPAGVGHPEPVERGWRRWLEMVEDGERLECDRATAVGRVAERGQAAIGRGDRGAPVRPVGGQVVLPDGRAGLAQVRRRTPRERARVQDRRPIGGERPEGPRERRQADACAHAPRTAIGSVRPRPVAIDAEDHRCAFDGADPPRAGREPVGQLDGRRQEVGPGEAPSSSMSLAPRVDGTRHRHGPRSALGHPRVPGCRRGLSRRAASRPS